MRVLSLFDYTGNMLKPWQEAGYECHLVDIQHPEGTSIREDGMVCHNLDLSIWFCHALTNPNHVLGGHYDFVACFPPCDSLAVSGARWFKGKGLRALEKSIAMFATAAEVAEASGAPYLIENPVSTISTYWRKPDYTFHPWEYAGWCGDDHYKKKTCLWTGGGFVMPEKRPNPYTSKEPDNRIHTAPPGPERKNFRSATPMGFARAVFEANAKKRAAA